MYRFAPLALAFLWIIVYFAVIFLLPASLRRARVRPSHITRIAIYSAILPFASSMIAVFLPEPFETLNHVLRPVLAVIDETLFDAVWRPILGSGINKEEAEEMTLAMLWPLWLAPFWGFACERYLRLPRPWLVTIILSILSALMVASVLLMATAAL